VGTRRLDAEPVVIVGGGGGEGKIPSGKTFVIRTLRGSGWMWDKIDPVGKRGCFGRGGGGLTEMPRALGGVPMLGKSKGKGNFLDRGAKRAATTKTRLRG